MVELTLVELLAAAAISVKAVTVLNKMNRTSHRWLARAWILLGGAAAHFVGQLVFSGDCEAAGALLLVAAAAVLLLDRRKTP